MDSLNQNKKSMEKKGNGGQMLTVEWIIIKAMVRASLRDRSNQAIPQLLHSQREHRKKLAANKLK